MSGAALLFLCQRATDSRTALCSAWSWQTRRTSPTTALAALKRASRARSWQAGCGRCWLPLLGTLQVLTRVQPQPSAEEPAKEWTCASCTLSNAVGTKECAVCGAAAPGVSVAQPKSSKPPGAAAVTAAPAAAASSRSCPACTYVNKVGALQCSMCATTLGKR